MKLMLCYPSQINVRHMTASVMRAYKTPVVCQISRSTLGIYSRSSSAVLAVSGEVRAEGHVMRHAEELTFNIILTLPLKSRFSGWKRKLRSAGMRCVKPAVVRVRNQAPAR